MAVFAGGAFGVSILAVLLLNHTLKATRDAVRSADDAVAETRRIGDLQVRPYIAYRDGATKLFRDGKDFPNDRHLTLDITLQNCGQTPGIVTRVTSAVYAPKGASGWGRYGGSARPLRVIIGPNQVEKVELDVLTNTDGKDFSVFAIGILIWYESMTGGKFEDHVWLYFDGVHLRQDYPVHGYDLYRPENQDH